MATVDRKYLDLTGLQKLVQKKALVVHPTNTETSAAAVKVGTDANGHVKIGAAITAADVGAVPTTRKVNNKPLSADITLGVSDISGAVPDSRTIAGIDLADDITNAELAQALGISGAMNFIGESTTDPAGSSGATVSGHTSWKKGDVVIYKRTGETNFEEYIAIADDNAHWELLGDADSYAQKSATITAGTGLIGGGQIGSNPTISHKTYTEASAAAVRVGRDSTGHVVLGSAISIATDGAHTHTVDIAANKVVTAVNTQGYSWSLDKGTNSANVKTVVTSYPGATSKLATTTVTGVSGSTTASFATAGTAKNVAAAGTATVYGKANVGEEVENVAIVTDTTSKIGAANVGTEVVAGQADVGTAVVAGQADVGTEVVAGTADCGTAITGVAKRGSQITYGQANVGTAVTGLITGFQIGSDTTAKNTYTAEYVADGNTGSGTLKLSSLTPKTTSVAPAVASSAKAYVCGDTVDIVPAVAATRKITPAVAATRKITPAVAATRKITPAVAASKTIEDFVSTTSIAPAVAAPNTQTIIPAVENGTITPYTFENVTVPKAAASATTVATGSVSTSGAGATVMTGLGTANTASVLADTTTITVSNPTSGAQATLAYSGTKGAVTGAGTATEAGGHSHNLA